jgi:hypothetical protein
LANEIFFLYYKFTYKFTILLKKALEEKVKEMLKIQTDPLPQVSEPLYAQALFRRNVQPMRNRTVKIREKFVSSDTTLAKPKSLN